MGDFEQMGLPGERPWGEVLERFSDGTARLRIINKLFREYSREEQRAWTGEEFGTAAPLPELHTFKKGDELLCRIDERGLWVPVVYDSPAGVQ